MEVPSGWQVRGGDTMRLPSEHGRSLALALAGHPQRPADTAQSATARGEPNTRPGHAVVAPASAPVTSTAHTQAREASFTSHYVQFTAPDPTLQNCRVASCRAV